jgi:hypothetical protein
MNDIVSHPSNDMPDTESFKRNQRFNWILAQIPSLIGLIPEILPSDECNPTRIHASLEAFEQKLHGAIIQIRNNNVPNTSWNAAEKNDLEQAILSLHRKISEMILSENIYTKKYDEAFINDAAWNIRTNLAPIFEQISQLEKIL